MRVLSIQKHILASSFFGWLPKQKARSCTLVESRPVELSPMLKEIYASTDVETDGPIPGMNSMLSFGSAAYWPDKTLVATFSANLETLPGAEGDPRTLNWWKTQPKAWEACRTDLQAPEVAMEKYLQWLKALPGKPVFVGYPVAFIFSSFTGI
jgi:hypothetical protein